MLFTRYCKAAADRQMRWLEGLITIVSSVLVVFLILSKYLGLTGISSDVMMTHYCKGPFVAGDGAQ